MKTTPSLAVLPLLLLALGGCTLIGGGGGGTETEGTEGSSGGEELAGGPTACLVGREWILDTEDAAAQLGEMLTANGLSIVSTAPAGGQTIWFDSDGTAGTSTVLSYTIVANLDSGMVMTMVQHHEGEPGGQWVWADEDEAAVTFLGWGTNYSVTTDTSINGRATPTSTMPAGGLGGLDGQVMTISCEGDGLTTQLADNPFVMHWVAGASR